MREMIKLFVAVNGSDQATGRSADRQESDGPLATLAGARDAIRRIKANVPVRVEIRGGSYELPEPLVFTPEDSGSEGAPITYAAYAGEHPVISGGRRLTGWQEAMVEGQRRWTLEIPEVCEGDWYFTQLFVNGQRRYRPRIPKKGFYRFAGLPDGHRVFDWYGPTHRAEYAEGDIQAWKNLGDVRVVALQHWFDIHLQIHSLDESKRIAKFSSCVISDLQDEEDKPARYYVDNVGEALTEPGEWYLDRETGLLTYLPLKGEVLDEAHIVAPRLNFLIKMMGKIHEGKPVHHLNFENLDFKYAEWDLPPECPGAIQAAFNVPAAIHMQGAEHCAFYGCTVAHVSQYAIESLAGSRHTKVVACHLYDLGAGGVKIGHEGWQGNPDQGEASFTGLDREALGWVVPGAPELIPGRDPAPGGYHLISDCHIHDGGLRYHSAVGVWIGNSGFNRVQYNEIHDFNYTAVSSGWNWHYAPTYTIGNRIEYNHLHHIGRGLLSDMGAIYTLGRHPGGVIRGNHIHDVTCNGYGGCGIYPDQGSSFWRIEDNVVHHTESAALSLNFGLGLQVRNNIFAGTRNAAIGRGREESIRAVLAERNIIVQSHGDMIAGFSKGASLFRHNIYFNTNGDAYRFCGLTWDTWREKGQDGGSLMADPLLQAPEQGDFATRSDSPISGVGITIPNASQAGPRIQECRPAALPDWPLVPDEPIPIFDLWLEDGQATMPTLDDRHRLLTYPSTAFLPAGVPTPVSVTLHNVGTLAAERRLSLNITPAGAAKVLGDKTKTLRLEPGERKAVVFDVCLDPEGPAVWLEVSGDREDVPVFAQAFRPRKDVTIPSMPSLCERQDEWAKLLAANPVTPIKDASGMEVASIRMAADDEGLLIMVDVQDENLLHVPDPPWIGSCVHVFAPGKDGFGKHKWLYLQPADDTHEAAIRYMDMRDFKIKGPIEDSRIISHSSKEGYRLMAWIPFARLGIDSGAKTFELEIHVDSQRDGKRQKFKLFGGENAWVMGMDGYGHITVQPEEL